MARPTVNIPLTLSYDTRGVAGLANAQAGKDQRRVNVHYEITRTAVDTTPDIALAKRPGVTVDAGTYGATAQAMYLVVRDPAGTWNPTPWAIVKNGTANNAVTASTTTTILTNADYYPRFWDVTDVSGTNYLVVQMQNSASPSATPAQKTYYAATIGGFTEISDTDYTGLSQRGKMEFMNGYAFQMDSRCRIYQSDLNSLSAWTSTNYLTLSTTQYPPQGIIKSRSQILAFSTDHVELFRNEGNATGSVLSRIANSEVKIGLAEVAGGGSVWAGKTSYYARIGDLTFFLGRYGGSQYDTSLVAYDGNRFEKVSRPYEDTLLSTATIYSISTMSFHGKVAVAIQTTAPTATTQKWLLFFPDINEMFEWESTVFGPINNGYHFAGATNTQKLYTFGATDIFQDDSNNYTVTVQFKLPTSSHEYKRMASFGVVADTTSDEQNLAVSFSDDDSGSFTTARNINLALKNKELYRGGTFRERFVKLTHTGTREVRLRRFYADIR